MLALVAEDLADQVGDAVDDLGLLGEVRRRVDEAAELDHPGHPVEVAAEGLLDLGDDVDAAEPGRGLAVLDAEVAADLADVLELAALDRHLPGDEDEVAGHHIGHVVGHRRRRLRQLDSQFLQTRVDLTSHVPCPPGLLC